MRRGELIAMVAMRDSQPVGRIAAIVNRAHNEYYSDRTGFFGFFDSIDDVEVARALFGAASAELKRRGMTSMRGPYNPTVNDECGVLSDGFDTAPFVMMPYNPAYYLDLYDACGLQRARDLHAFYISASTQAPERILKICERVKRATGLRLRNIEMKRLNDELKIIRELYNATLDRNWGFVPLSMEEMEYAAEDLKSIVDPSLVMIAEKDGVPAGFSMVIPNINEFLGRTKRSSILMRILKFAWMLKTRSPREARLAVLGVKPEFRNKGLAALFYAETLLRGKKTYIGGELSWVEETNEDIMRGIEVMGAKRYKTYRIYEQGLGAAGSPPRVDA